VRILDHQQEGKLNAQHGDGEQIKTEIEKLQFHSRELIARTKLDQL